MPVGTVVQNQVKCPVCETKVSQGSAPGRDLLWDAIPLFELFEIAKAKAGDCASKSEDEIRNCAEQVVRSQICGCCSGEATIIDSIVEEFVQKLREAS